MKDALFTEDSLVNLDRLLMVIADAQPIVIFDTGEKVHVSKETAKQLIEAAKSNQIGS